MSSEKIKNRKDQHIRLCLEKDVTSTISNGFDRYRLVYNALPEINFDDIDISTTFLGKKLNYPFLISAMTGGTPYGKKINKRLAVAAQKLGVAMCVGSQRAMLKDPSVTDSFAVRDVAPDIVLFANVGAVQLNYGYTAQDCQKLVDAIDADALVLHLNPLHEAVQPEGDRNFKKLSEKIKQVVESLSVPVIVKEVGCGISGEVAQRLHNCGVKIIDVAGAGGISFPVVEGYRAGLQNPKRFGELGMSTADCIIDVRKKVGDKLSVIASGGITNGIEAAKALALGADLVGFASPLLRAATISVQEVETVLQSLAHELKITLFSTGAKNLKALANKIQQNKQRECFNERFNF